MAFDVEGYRKAAKDAGFSDEQIQKDIDEETQGVAAKGADANMANVKVGKDFMGIPEWLQPAAGLTGAALLGAGATGLGMKLKDRMSKPEVSSPRVEPTFGIPDIEVGAQPQSKFTPPQGDVTDVASRPVGEARMQIGGPRALPTSESAPSITPAQQVVAPPAEANAPVAPKPIDPVAQARIDAINADNARKQAAHDAEQQRKAELHQQKMAVSSAKSTEKKIQNPPAAKLKPEEVQMMKKSEENRISKEMEAQVKAAQKPVVGAAGPAVTPPATPVAQPVAAAPVAAAPAAQAVPAPSTQAASAFEDKLGKPTVTTGSGMPAYAGEGGESAKMKKEFGTIKDVPKGYVFVPEGQYMDIMRNAVGQEAFTSKLGEFGGYPKTTESAYEQSRAINKSLGRATREEAKAAGTALGDVTPSITKKVAGSKLVKVAGVGGALISLADVANAKEAAQTIGEMFLPIGATPSSLNANEEVELASRRQQFQKEAQKLGSPYRSVPPPR